MPGGLSQPLNGASDKFRNTAGVVPVGHIDIGMGIDQAAMRGTEGRARDLAWIDLVVSPLRGTRVVAEKGDRRVVSVENGQASFELRDDRIVPMETCLAWAP